MNILIVVDMIDGKAIYVHRANFQFAILEILFVF